MESTASIKALTPMISESREHTDEELMARIKKEGDRSAFAELVTRHTEKYYRLAYRMLVSREEAEDLVQESFLMLWSKPNIWDSGRNAKFTTWFYRVVTNACLDRKKKTTTLPLDAGYDHPDRSAGTEELVEMKRRKDDIETYIAELPDSQQTALALCFYEGISNKEAAEIMGVSVKAVESLLMRAKASLRRKITGTTQREGLHDG
ncbi:MAG: sigma-70 family RNA polymerase sigma factor [Deltaproteobacteria bacterium]